jgi:thioredoxin type arsenate reductase
VNVPESATPIRVLFVCTGNSARSQIAEAVLRRIGAADFEVASAGTEPHGVNPYTLRVLAAAGIDWSGAVSKSVDVFLGQSFDYVITVCDRAKAVCPVFPGHGETLHWDLDDPADQAGSDAEKLAAFERTYLDVTQRVGSFVEAALRAAGRESRATIAG